jgi:hypothetical protein
LWFIDMPFAFATLSDGGRETPAGWRDYLGEEFTIGISPISPGLVAVIAGIYLAATRDSPADQGAGAKNP